MALSTIHTALMYATFEATKDTSIDPSKTYYEKLEGHYVAVENPDVSKIASYYEKSAIKKLICVKDYPDMGGEPEQIEATTLCDEKQTFVEGVQQTSTISYTANYEKEDFAKLYALKGQVVEFGVWFGQDEQTKEPDGHDGKFTYQGTLNVYVKGGGVNEVREITITTTPNTTIDFE